MNATAFAQRMPPIPPELTRLGLAFLAAADDLAEVVVSDTSWAMIPGSWIPAQSFRLSLSNLLVIRGGLEGAVGKALSPIAARMLLEDGARWSGSFTAQVRRLQVRL